MKKFSVKFRRRVFVVMASVLVFVIGLSNIAHDQAAALNANLPNVQTSKTIKGDDTGLDTEYFKRKYTTQEELKDYVDATCREVEEEGIVLLRNENNALPLEKGSNVSLFGQGAVKFNYSSTGSSANAATNTYPTLKDALKDLNVNDELWDFYLNGAASKYKRGKPNLVYTVNEAPWSVYNDAVKNSFSQYGDAAIYVLSRDSGEGMDISTVKSDGLDGSYLSITAQEQEVLRELTNLKASGVFGSVIVILNSAVPVQLDFMFDDTIEIDAALWVGNVGATGIYAINDILVGNAVPSGRLSDTYAKDNFSSPAMASWAANANKSFSQKYTNAANYSKFDETFNMYAVYVEGIYVGYRYYETRYADVITGAENVGEYDYDKDVAFPFGHGLSYTEFMYSGFTLTESEDKFTATVDVTNIGGYAGKEVVQIYLQKPYTDYDRTNGVEKSAIELVGFAKTKLLESGDSETVSVDIDKSLLKSYDVNGAGTYIVEDGDYYFATGTDAHNALNNILASNGYEVSGYPDETLCVKWHNDTFDSTTYSKSDINESVEIGNKFDFCDINRYEGRGDNGVTYVSRNDWAGTFPTEAVSLHITEQMAADLKSHKELVEDGSDMPVYGAENGLTLAMLRSTEEDPVPYDDERWEKLLDQMTFGDQAYLITNGQHNTVVLKSVGKPATRDENGPNGVSGSTTNSSFPSEGIWASTFNADLLYRVGACLGEDALAAGITGLYAPGVNLHRTPFGGRAHEYFSEDPYLMAMCSVFETKGLQSKGVWAYVKHYAVNDEETNRNGVGIWLNEQEMREIVLLPFEYSFKPTMGNAHATMTSFNRIGCLWTSASSALMEDVLRGEWGFDGFSITDMAASNAQSFMTFDDGIANGTDCYDGPGTEDSLNDFRGSAMFANKMREAAHRILYVTANYSAAMNGIGPTDKVVPVRPWWSVVLIAAIIVVSVLTAASAAWFVLGYVKKTKKEA